MKTPKHHRTSSQALAPHQLAEVRGGSMIERNPRPTAGSSISDTPPSTGTAPTSEPSTSTLHSQT